MNSFGCLIKDSGVVFKSLGQMGPGQLPTDGSLSHAIHMQSRFGSGQGWHSGRLKKASVRSNVVHRCGSGDKVLYKVYGLGTVG